jgi:hypothetical protein
VTIVSLERLFRQKIAAHVSFISSAVFDVGFPPDLRAGRLPGLSREQVWAKETMARTGFYLGAFGRIDRHLPPGVVVADARVLNPS